MSDSIHLKTITLPLLSPNPRVIRESYSRDFYHIKVAIAVYFEDSTAIIEEDFSTVEILQQSFYCENPSVTDLPKVLEIKQRISEDKFIITFSLTKPFKVNSLFTSISTILI